MQVNASGPRLAGVEWIRHSVFRVLHGDAVGAGDEHRKPQHLFGATRRYIQRLHVDRHEQSMLTQEMTIPRRDLAEVELRAISRQQPLARGDLADRSAIEVGWTCHGITGITFDSTVVFHSDNAMLTVNWSRL